MVADVLLFVVEVSVRIALAMDQANRLRCPNSGIPMTLGETTMKTLTVMYVVLKRNSQAETHNVLKTKYTCI